MKPYRNYFVAVLVLLIVITLFGCSNKEKIHPIKKPVNKVISLAPNLTEIIFKINAGDKLIGVTSDCDFPKETKGIKNVGKFGRPDLERILFLKPDLVVYSDVEDLSIIARLYDLRIPVRRYQIDSFEELYGTIANFGEIFAKKGHALQLIKSIQNRVERISKRAKPYGKVKVLLQIWDRPFIGVGGSGFLNEIIDLAGGQNVLGGLAQTYPKVADELILQTNPDIIFQLHERSYFFNQEKFKHLKAVSENGIIIFSEPDLLLRPGPRLVDGLEKIFFEFDQYRQRQKHNALPK